MITQTIDSRQYVRKARQIKAKIPLILTRWGLVPKFSRWRLTQDPETGMVALFGVLNSKFIATHTTTPFSDYFDPRLLNDMEAELQVPVISSSTDGLRYDFILERGLIDMPAEPQPAASSENTAPDIVVPQILAEQPITADSFEDQIPANPEVGAFLKEFDKTNLKNEAAQAHSFQDLPEMIQIESEKLNKVE